MAFRHFSRNLGDSKRHFYERAVGEPYEAEDAKGLSDINEHVVRSAAGLDSEGPGGRGWSSLSRGVFSLSRSEHLFGAGYAGGAGGCRRDFVDYKDCFCLDPLLLAELTDRIVTEGELDGL